MAAVSCMGSGLGVFVFLVFAISLCTYCIKGLSASVSTGVK
jgi:hypothetical protein